MCRIAGIAAINPVQNRADLLTGMLNAVARGGPDDSGTYFDDLVALGHRRLSIIDLSSAGHQPMALSDELIISFNGEIYNYQLLRKELEQSGCIFTTHTDTEVILHAYKNWGTAAFDRFEGIFAFAIYDKILCKLLLVRDHIGVKPLYYSIINNTIIFGSEVRVFHAFDKDWTENHDWKIIFLAFGSIPHPYTTLQDVYQLKPGCYLSIDLVNFSYEIENYDQQTKQINGLDSRDELALTKESIYNAVRKNLISDAPIGVFLSGGIDSSVITLLSDEFTNGIKALSVNFKEATFDEYPYQKTVIESSRKVNHISYNVSEDMFWNSLPDIWEAMDQPTIDGINSYFISKCAKDNGLKVVLSGLGADEIFGGYASFKRIRWLKRLRSFLPFKQFFSKIIGYRRHAFKRLVYLDLLGPVGDYLFLRGLHTPETISNILQISEEKVWEVLGKVTVDMPDYTDNNEYSSLLESRIYMRSQLLKDTDCMSMWHALEVRVPFLDIALLRNIESIKPIVRYKQKIHKYLLVESMKDILPLTIVNRVKKGFTFPMAVWIKSRLESVTGLMDVNPTVLQIKDDFESGREHWSKYWSLVVLKQFK